MLDTSDVYTFFGGPIAQLAEPHPFKVGVPGSSPGGTTMPLSGFCFHNC